MATATLGTREAAERLGVSPQTLRRFADAGILPAVRLTPSSPRRFRAEDVEQLLERAYGGRTLREGSHENFG